MPVTSPHIWYPDGPTGSAYDLRTITMWNPQGDRVVVRFDGTNTAAVVSFNAVAFDAAKQNSLDNGG